MPCNPVLIVNDFSQAFYSYIGHWSLSKIEHIPWSKKLLNFLLRVRLIRSLAGIIKSLVSSEVDIWVSVAATPPPPSHTSERPARQDEYRHKFTNLQSLDPRERTLDWFLQPSNPSEQSTQAERSCDTTWKSFYSQCSVFAKLTEKLRHFRVLKQRAALRKLAILRWLGKTNRDCHIVNSRAHFAAHPLCRWQGGQKWRHLPDPGDGKVCGWWVGSRVISSGTIQLTLSLKYLFLQFTFMSVDKYPIAA